MAYQPTEWLENDLISIDRMNKLERGLMAVAADAEQQHAALEAKLQNDIAEVQANTVPITATVNGHALSSNVTLTAEEVGAVPTTRTINGKALDADINLTASNVGARSNSWVPTAAQVGAIPSSPVAAMSVLTQAEYDTLTTKDAATLYLIKEEA